MPMEESMAIDRRRDECQSTSRKVNEVNDAKIDSLSFAGEGWSRCYYERSIKIGRSNRLRQMDAEGLNEGIGCMPMKIGLVSMDGTCQ